MEWNIYPKMLEDFHQFRKKKKPEERLKYNNKKKNWVKQKVHQDNTNKTVTAAKRVFLLHGYTCLVRHLIIAAQS